MGTSASSGRGVHTPSPQADGLDPRSGSDSGVSRVPRRRRFLKWATALLLIVVGGLLFIQWVVRPAALLDPASLFAADGALTVLEVSGGAFPELDLVIEAVVTDLPALLEFRGLAVDLPPGSLSVITRSGPWRVALWESADRDRVGFFAGGEAYGWARRRWLASVLDQKVPGQWRSRIEEVGGAVVIGSDDRLVSEIRRRAESAPARSIPRDGIRLVHEDAQLSAGVELWFERASDFGSPADGARVIERWSGADGAIDWRGRLSRYGVEWTLREETPGQRTWEATGIQQALREALAEFRRF